MKKTYSLEELEKMPTLSVSQADDLKVDTGNMRVWLSRMTVADGMPYNNQVTIEELQVSYSNGRSSKYWGITKQYEAE